jgi:two-component system sensor histidine kinase ChvG
VSASCTENLSLATRYQDPAGEDEILTSITPVLTPAGCWIVLVAHPYASMLGTSLAEPVWQRFEVQVAAAIYLAMAIITIIVFLSMRHSVLRFRGLARDIRTGHAGNRSLRRRTGGGTVRRRRVRSPDRQAAGVGRASPRPRTTPMP